MTDFISALRAIQAAFHELPDSPIHFIAAAMVFTSVLHKIAKRIEERRGGS